MINKQKLTYQKSSSEFVGVSWRKTNKKWASYIVIMSKLYFLGLFENEKDASKCYFENLRNWEEKKILPKAKTYSSSHNGIYYKKERNKWGLSIMRNGKRKFYGYFNSEEEAYIRKIELKI
ncbi:MAG: hypothetical protein KA215_04550 [Flavobacterium sp.]|nr:hypothetical protein [Flavobacterium sp.]